MSMKKDYDSDMELLNSENTTSTSDRQNGLSFRKSSFKEPSISLGPKPEDGEDDTSRGRDISELASEFGRRTTAHGWGRVTNAKGRIVKLMWLTFTLVALTATMVQVSMLLVSFMQFNTELKWHLSMSEIMYPSVTVCNIQPYSISTAQSLMKNESSKFYQWYNVTKNLDYFRNLAVVLNKSKEFEWVENRMKQPIGYYENIGDEAIIVGHQPRDFMLRCAFGLSYCSIDNFTFYQSPTYYNCFTFNGGNVSKDKLISKTSGPQEGLSMIVYLENDNGDDNVDGTYHTLSTIGNAGGVRVIVHAPDTRPSPIDQGIDVPTGYSANIGLDVNKYTRTDHPYGDCIESEEWTTDRFVYSSHACLALCQQLYVIKHCGCISSTLPVANNAVNNMTFCAYWNISSPDEFLKYFQSLTCEAESLMQFATTEEIKSQCNCHPACSEFAYRTDLSYSYWPLDFTQEDFYKTMVLDNPIRDQLKAYNNLKEFNISDLITNGLIRKNFARVNVFLKGMTIEEYIEKSAYELPNLFSDFGGSCGLWIGMSIITWCEVGELFVHIVYNGVKRLLWKSDQMQHVKAADEGKY